MQHIVKFFIIFKIIFPTTIIRCKSFTKSKSTLFYQKRCYTSIQSDATSTLAAQRIDKVRNDLIAAGIPSGIITTSILTFDVSDTEDGTEASDTPDTVAISLTSAATCK
jgi:hypothetical protein